MELTLKILLGLYILQALIKFVSLLAVPYATRIKRIAAVQGHDEHPNEKSR
ncbi:hypothetical protein [Streptosporangium sp. NBC_01756]|uniref:hypothetical protein n=1 Tax=Streptosporangium sp. NBC_01756 TaxID=2975950 RepID=UPI002DDC59A4|nr:hypothetical protein [Streptosporangium sp. NBC_01756]WSC89588.1 hypothetical protein OIE48_15820 [Streptosporangium sp. NBC_01756]